MPRAGPDPIHFRHRFRLHEVGFEAPLPAGFEYRLRMRVRQSEKSKRTPWLMAIAAAIIVACAATWAGVQSRPVPESLAAVMRIGLNDHVHCAVMRQSSNFARGVDKLAPEYQPVLAAVHGHVPVGMQLAAAHECRFEGRAFIHMIFGDHRNLLSVIVTRKQDGEALGRLRATVLDGYPIAAAEAGHFLVYTVSDLATRLNRDVLQAIIPALRRVLDRIG